MAQERRPVLGTKGSRYHRNAYSGCQRISYRLCLDQVRELHEPRLKLITELRCRLYVALVTDALDEYLYDADLAGLTYFFEASSLGFYVTISGYNDKLHVLLRDVLEKAKSLEVRADRLVVIKEKVKDISQMRAGHLIDALDIPHTDQTRLGEFFPRSELSTIGLLRTIHHEREAVDRPREVTSPRL
jgi:Middle or third domain of peptidase_M16